MKDANWPDFVAVEGKLSRIVEHQDERAIRRQPVTRGLKMSRQNLTLANTTVGKKTVGCFGVGPVLTSPGNASTDIFGEPLQMLPQRLIDWRRAETLLECHIEKRGHRCQRRA